MPERLQPRGHLRLENLADIDFGDAEVAVGIVLHLVQSFEIPGRNVEDHSFRNDRHAVGASVAQALDDRAHQRIDDGLEPNGLGKLLRNEG